MPFQLTTPTAALLNSVTPRKEIHGDEPVSAISLGLSITGANTLLDHLDGGKLRNALYMAVPDQEPLPGVEPSTPLLRARGIEEVKCAGTLEGWTLTVENGIDDTSAIVLGGAKIDKFRVKPVEGGSVTLLFRVGTSDISEDEAGALFGRLGQEIMIRITAPVIADRLPDNATIDGTTGHPGLAASQAAEAERQAGDLFAETYGDGEASDQHAGDFGQADDDSAGPGTGSSDDAGDGAADSEGGETDAAGDVAEFEAGAKAALAKAGVAPRRSRKTRAGVE